MQEMVKNKKDILRNVKNNLPDHRTLFILMSDGQDTVNAAQVLLQARSGSARTRAHTPTRIVAAF